MESRTGILSREEGRCDDLATGYVPSMFLEPQVAANLGLITSTNGLRYAKVGAKVSRLYRMNDPDLPPPLDENQMECRKPATQ